MVSEKHLIAPEGYPFIFINLVLVVVALFVHPILVFLFVVLLLFNLNFFRNPKRNIPQDKTAVVSPADGKIIFVGEVLESRLLHKKMQRISIFMSPLNVHVNRIPFDGHIKKILYNKGKYLAAFSEKASLDNEQNAIWLQTESGVDVVFTQIAGWLARRICCYAKEGEAWPKGKIFGMIRYGSRMDVYLPLDCKINAKVGEDAIAGETILAHLN